MSDFNQSLYNGEAAQLENATVAERLVNKANVVFALNMVAQFAYGAQIYLWYPNWVKTNDELFPAPISGTCVHDEEWGLGTKEISAWTSASYWYMGAYGWASFIWMANTFTDMEGGIFHEIFYRSSQALTFAPLVTMWFALNVKKSYAATQTRFAADVASYPDASAACEQSWLYNDSVVDYNAYNFKSNQTGARILYMFATAILSLWTSIYAMDQIEEDFLAGREYYDWKKAQEAEAEAEPEDDSAADDSAADDSAEAAPAEDQFF